MTLYNRLLTRLDGKMGPALRVAPEKAPLGVARCLFGATKLRASRLDWHFFRGNSNNCVVLTGPKVS